MIPEYPLACLSMANYNSTPHDQAAKLSVTTLRSLNLYFDGESQHCLQPRHRKSVHPNGRPGGVLGVARK